MFNKKTEDPISLQEEKEMTNLTPIVAEIIKQADEFKYIGDMAQNMNLHLTQTKDKLLGSAKVFEERDVGQIHRAFGFVMHRLDNYMQRKRENTIKENQLAHQILAIIREEEAIALKE